MLPFAYPPGLGPNAVAGTTVQLPANGGTVIIPFVLPDQLCAQSVTVQTTDASGAHSVEFGFFDDRAELPRSGSLQAFSYTGSGNAVRTGNLSQPIYLGPGTVWMVLRNTGATVVTLGAVAPGTLGGNQAAAAVLPGPLSGGIGNPSWAGIANVPLIRISGSLAGVLPGAVI